MPSSRIDKILNARPVAFTSPEPWLLPPLHRDHLPEIPWIRRRRYTELKHGRWQDRYPTMDEQETRLTKRSDDANR